MHKINHYQTKAQKRAARVRAKVRGTSERPRLTVYRSNKHVYCQVIDDTTGETLAAVNELSLAKTAGKELKGTKTERAQLVGEALAKELTKKKITKVAFDRGSYRYHGRVKTVAEAVRANGVEV